MNHIDALAPYQPVHMRVIHCPIDTRLSFAQANKLIRDLRPRHLVVPEQYITPPTLQPSEYITDVKSYIGGVYGPKTLEEGI